MIELKTQFPYVDENGKTYPKLIKFYAEDEETKQKYYIIQKETGNKYESAIDIRPCKYTYEPTDELIKNSSEEI